MYYKNINEDNRQRWIERTLRDIPSGLRILDAGAGELRNRRFCNHLNYVSQDFCQYEGRGNREGLQTGTWDTSKIDIVSDITSIPMEDESFDVVLCSEVLEHVPDPVRAVKELTRLLRPGGTLILTAPFASIVHFAPQHYATGFSRYWYEHHLASLDFNILELTPNGDWFLYTYQEIMRMGSMARKCRDPYWLLAYVLGYMAKFYFSFRRGKKAEDVACFGWHCVAKKR